jgi:hypothetical protein
MASMCETCKCSTYYNEELDMFSCENECPCCNDPDYESEWDIHLRLFKQLEEYAKLHIISLEQDSAHIEKQMNEIEDMDSDEYKSLEIEDISLNGQMIGVSHLLRYMKELHEYV